MLIEKEEDAKNQIRANGWGHILIGKLKGDGWELRVWKKRNLGWTYAAQKCGVEVHPSGLGYVCCMSTLRGKSEAWVVWAAPAKKKVFKNPNHAVEAALSGARKDVDGLDVVLRESEKVFLHGKRE